VPIYEYKCTKCGKELEVMHKVSDPAPAECPECKAQGTLEKLVSRTSFQLKGGGWYSDLYASAKKDSSSGTSTPAASSTPASSTSTPAAAAPSTSSSGSSSGGGSGGSGGSTT
jgi:putative FmdB family regulatory protein